MPSSRVPLERGTEQYQLGNGRKYPNPFFNLASNFIPTDIKTLFSYCRGFFYTNGFIRNIVTKLTEYPITDILYVDQLDEETKTKYNVALNDYIKIKEFIISVGLDYYTFGNCFISANLDFKRYLKCNAPTCRETSPIDKVAWKYKNFAFEGLCPKCTAMNSPFIIEDVPIKNLESFNFVRWSPEQIEIEYDELTGVSSYFYTISPARKKRIVGGHRKTVAKTPKLFLQALKEKKLIELDKNNLYHFKRPTLAEENQAWGKPAILPAMKDLYYMQTLQRGNEAVANEHIVPKKAIYPAVSGPIDPFQSIGLGNWRGKMEEEVRKWKKDPNYIGIFPIPIGYQQMGGDAKLLLLSPELRFLEENIITNMGVPLDFIRGGATWTGSSISLRIVENHFLPYREMLSHFLNYFVVKKLHDILGFPTIKLKFKELKMTDDSEAKQLMLNLREGAQISNRTMLDKFGIDYWEEQKNLKLEQQDRLEMQKGESIAMAMAQGAAQETLARHEARAQHAIQDESHRIREEQFEKEVLQENQNVYVDSSQLIERLAVQLSMTPPERQEALFSDLARQAPITAGLVLERFLADMAPPPEEGGGDVGVVEGPGAGAPKKDNKKDDQVKPKSSKSRGASRGSAT